MSREKDLAGGICYPAIVGVLSILLSLIVGESECYRAASVTGMARVNTAQLNTKIYQFSLTNGILYVYALA